MPTLFKAIIYFIILSVMHLTFPQNSVLSQSLDNERIIVKKKSNASSSSLFPQNKSLKNEKELFQSELIKEFPSLSNISIINVDKDNTQSVIEELKKSPYVEYIEIDGFYQSSVVPNDDLYSKQWQYKKKFMPMENVWDIKFGNPANLLAIIDSGADIYHEDIKKRVWKNPDEIEGNNIDDDLNGYIDDIHGWNVYDDSNNVYDEYGHGTQVFSVAAASSNNSKGITGINWQGKVVLVKANVKHMGVYNYSDIAKALVYASSIPQVRIINLSLGGGADSQSIRNLIKEIVAQNKIVVIAGAGNDGNNLSTSPFYPASYPGVIAVSSYGRNGFSSFSNYGYKIDVAAPGEKIYVAFSGGGYGSVDGTSVATPHVSGLGLLFSMKNPGFKAQEITQALKLWTYCPIENPDCGPRYWNPYYGNGRVSGEDLIDNKCEGQTKVKSSAFISSPVDRATFINTNSTVNIIGIAKSNKFASYDIQWGFGDNPSNWLRDGVSLVNGGTVQIDNSTLGNLDLSKLSANGFYTLRLIIKGDAGCLRNHIGQSRVGIFINR